MGREPYGEGLEGPFVRTEALILGTHILPIRLLFKLLGHSHQDRLGALVIDFECEAATMFGFTPKIRSIPLHKG